jgi:hypothetical protein
MYTFINETEMDLDEILDFIDDFISLAIKKMGIDKHVTIKCVSDDQNAKNTLGKTGFYNPQDYSATIFVDNRHKKDIMKSISHELIHHGQNCRGEFDKEGLQEGGDGYAQNNLHLREMEKEAYLEGCMLFRDWEDNKKQQLEEQKRNNEMFYRVLGRK